MRPARSRCGLALLGATLAAAGCLSKPALVSQSFSIDPPAPRPASPAGVILTLARVEVAPPYAGQALVYRTADHVLERDPYAKFAAPPGWLLTAAIRGYLANADFVRDVVAPGDRAPSDATVEVTVSEIVGALRASGSFAILTARFRVVTNAHGAQGRPELLLKTYSKTNPIPKATAADVVNGWNQSLAEIMAEFESDLRVFLTAARAPARS